MNISYWIKIIFIIVVIVIIMRMANGTYLYNPGCDLDTNGYCLIKNIMSSAAKNKLIKDIKNGDTSDVKNQIINNKKLLDVIKKKLGNDYVFQDYVMILKKSSIHTCHRDYNSELINKNQKYPSYTMLVFLEDMDRCLDVIPKSHKNLYTHAINITDQTKSVVCNPTDALIFNASLVHSGSFNDKPDNIRIQFKITHKDDLKELDYYQGYHKIIDKSNNVPSAIKYAQKFNTCQFPILSDVVMDVNTEKERKESGVTKISPSQKAFSKVFYGDSNYYDLKDINVK